MRLSSAILSIVIGLAFAVPRMPAEERGSYNCSTIRGEFDSRIAPGGTGYRLRTIIFLGVGTAVPICSITAGNANTCSISTVAPGVGGCPTAHAGSCLALRAAAYTTETGFFFCQWDCGVVCGTYSLDNTDGLPVELLELQVE